MELPGGAENDRTQGWTSGHGGRHRLDERAHGHEVRVQSESPSRDRPAELAGDVRVGADRVDVVREPWPVQHLPVDHACHRPEQQQQAANGDGHMGQDALHRPVPLQRLRSRKRGGRLITAILPQ